MRSMLLVGLIGCATAESAPAPSAKVRVTPAVAAPCGPDYLERHATSVADLDHDGTLDRPSITRTADAIVVKLHQLPSLREAGSWKLLPANGYVELATPHRRDGKDGDLWIMVGSEQAPKQWSYPLYRLEPAGFTTVTTKHLGFHIRVDVDGDGRVDPIASTNDVKASKVQAFVAGTWIDVPAILPNQVHGVPTTNDQEEAFDLDGNGVRELVVEREDAIAIIETPSMREVWRAKGKPWKPRLVKWGGAYVLAVLLDDKLKVFATDAKHALIATLAEAQSYSEVYPLGTRLALTGYPWHFYDRANPAKSIATSPPLVGRLDDDAAPFGPLRLVAADPPSYPTMGAMADPIELRLVDPRTLAAGRTAWRAGRDHAIDHDTTASLVDLERDGRSEVLLDDITRTAFHHGASWNTMKLRLVDGAGTLLWEEARARTDEWTHEDGKDGKRGRMTRTRLDGTHVRAFDLGDGTMTLRVRSPRDEYYILAAGSKLTAIPVCLE